MYRIPQSALLAKFHLDVQELNFFWKVRHVINRVIFCIRLINGNLR